MDAGADAVIGHGPHILRGIEIYRGRPIFYSLGNFIFENDTLTHLPADSYTNYGLGHTNTVADAIDAKSKNGTRGYVTIPEVWQTVIPSWTMKDGKLQELLLYPVELGFGQPRQRLGTPAKSTNDAILHSLQRLSAPYGTRIVVENHVGKVMLD